MQLHQEIENNVTGVLEVTFDCNPSDPRNGTTQPFVLDGSKCVGEVAMNAVMDFSGCADFYYNGHWVGSTEC